MLLFWGFFAFAQQFCFVLDFWSGQIIRSALKSDCKLYITHKACVVSRGKGREILRACVGSRVHVGSRDTSSHWVSAGV